ncbi:S8 family peptidase [Clostridium perfringens]|uniref:S8 family peptidase n=1 Tax=Clostridium perfringens TaxID=1502 RepID=UPI0024BCB7AD|nr:S8 family serine peptidase [Clostridium perfringens]ELC8463948.1 S8 family serine peptidase [Clostridium perfringens]
MNNINLNEEIKVYDLINDEHKDLLWGLRFVALENSWKYINKKNLSKIRIALIDSGVDMNHEDLKSSLCEGYNFIDNNYNTDDDFGHGTRIAGVIAAEKNNWIGVAGVASGSKLVPLKVMNSSGRASIENVIKAVEWCIKNDIDIINLSIGYQRKGKNLIFNNFDYYDKEKDVIDKALKKGITIISSVGNHANEAMNYPACLNGVISVASYGIYSDTLEIYSAPKNNKCSKKTIYAPGQYIYTTEINNRYIYEFGSSIACGFVTGAIALLKSIKKDLKPLEVQQLLLETCTQIDDGNMKILNIDSAVSALKKRCEEE